MRNHWEIQLCHKPIDFHKISARLFPCSLDSELRSLNTGREQDDKTRSGASPDQSNPLGALERTAPLLLLLRQGMRSSLWLQKVPLLAFSDLFLSFLILSDLVKTSGGGHNSIAVH